VSSAKGSRRRRCEYNDVDGEDPWLIKVKDGRSCSSGPEERRVGKEIPVTRRPPAQRRFR